MRHAGLLAGDHPVAIGDLAALAGTLPVAEARSAAGPVEVLVFDRDASAHGSVAWIVRTTAPRAAVMNAARDARLPDPGPVSWYEVDDDDDDDDDRAPARRRGEAGVTMRPEPGIRKVTFHRRAPGVDAVSYQVRFAAHRAIAAIHHANAARYRQSIVTAFDGPDAHAADGISEHWYADLDEATTQHFARPDSAAVVRADVMEWLDVPSAIVGYARCWAWR